MQFSELIEYIVEHFKFSEDVFLKLILSFVILLILWIVRQLIFSLWWKKIEDIQVKYRVRKIIGYTVFVVAGLLIGRLWFEIFQSLATLIGLISAGIAIALKDIILDVAGWFYLIVKRPFQVGDRIQVGEHAGDVIDVRIFKFTLMEIGNWVDAEQSTGRIIHIPNEFVFNKVLANYGSGFSYIWDEIPILLTFESNYIKAKELFSAMINEYSKDIGRTAHKKVKEAEKHYMIYYKNLTPIVYLSVKQSGVLLTIRYLCQPKKRRPSQDHLWDKILEIINSHNDITLAYPTVRYFDNASEGSHSNKKTTK